MVIRFEVEITEEQQQLIANFLDWAHERPARNRLASKNECRHYFEIYIKMALKSLEDLKPTE